MMHYIDFINTARKIATQYKTLYVSGCFGAPMTPANKTRYSKNNAYNRQPARVTKIMKADRDVFGFDCVCLIKGILWNFTGDVNAQYGGAQYASGGVPDIGENAMIKRCKNVSTDFSKCVPGAMLWLDGHAGIYLGDGLAAECTPIWKDGVQITAVANIGRKAGYNCRTWTKWGLLPWVDYTQPDPGPAPDPLPDGKKYIPVLLDGKLVQCIGTVENGITYIQLRNVADPLGLAVVGWDAQRRIATVTTKKE